MVKEASCSFTINPQFIAPAGSSPIEIKAVNEGSRAPVLRKGDVASKDDVERNHWSNANM